MNKLLILILVMMQSYNSFACSCIGKRTIKEEFKKSDIIFIGKILSKNTFIVQDNSLPLGYKMYKAEFKILRLKLYKGKITQDTITIITGVGSGDCGVDFTINKEYIIYATYSNKYFESGSNVPQFLYTDICTRTIFNNKKEQRKLKRLS